MMAFIMELIMLLLKLAKNQLKDTSLYRFKIFFAFKVVSHLLYMKHSKHKIILVQENLKSFLKQDYTNLYYLWFNNLWYKIISDV